MLFVHGPKIGVGEGEEREAGVLRVCSTDGFGFIDVLTLGWGVTVYDLGRILLEGWIF